MRSAIDVSADALRAEAPAFTRRNLYFAVRRAHDGGMSDVAFEAALRRRLARGALPGLLPARTRSRARKSVSTRNDAFPAAILLVDRPAIRDLFAAIDVAPKLGGVASEDLGLAVVCIDGTPAALVRSLVRGFAEGLRAPVLYLHDATTIIYPFAVEPLATLVKQNDPRPIDYRDLGLPPLGAIARRFDDPVLPSDEPIFELEAIPPATLLRYCVKSARSARQGIRA